MITIQTERLQLRAFTLDDAADVQRLAGDRQVAATTLVIPHPYPDGEAERWIGGHAASLADGSAVTLAVTDRGDGRLLGCVGLRINAKHRHAEMGYWIGRPEWGRGYATESAAAVLRYGFDDLALHRIHAHHFASNPSSGRVLEKIGMTREGLLRAHVRKSDRFEDIVMYGALASDHRPG